MAITAVSNGSDFQAAQAGVQASGPAGQNNLTDEEKQEVADLKKRDTEVRAHEQAHVAAGGQYVRGGPSYKYESGPDGKRYAVGGEVSIDTSPVPGDPRATIAKMQVVKRAAFAPAQPSGQDRAVAAQASQEQAKAQRELAQESQGKGALPAGGGASTAPNAGPGTNLIESEKNPRPFPKTVANTYASHSYFPSNSPVGSISAVSPVISTLG